MVEQVQRVMHEGSTVVGQVDGQLSPRYAGLTTFARLPMLHEVEDYDVAVVGIPFDAGVTYRSGARFGPNHIRQASRLLRPHNPALGVDPFGDQQVVDAGDLTANPFDIAAAMTAVESGAYDLIERGARLLSLGGDHTIAYPLLRAMHRVHGPVALLHFDAHLDTWDTYFNAPLTHGTPFRRAAEEGLFVEGASAHLGVRGSLYSAEDLVDDARLGLSIIRAMDYQRRDIDDIVADIRVLVGDHPVYISVDIDVLDPAHAPATGTPEAGGMTSRELLATLQGLRGLNVVGADIVEVSPSYDQAEITAVAASNIAYDLISLFALSPKR